eukprot:COSAG01_NODE_2274_length_8021_cov_15.958218_4_plen_42_part_00
MHHDTDCLLATLHPDDDNADDDDDGDDAVCHHHHAHITSGV